MILPILEAPPHFGNEAINVNFTIPTFTKLLCPFYKHFIFDQLLVFPKIPSLAIPSQNVCNKRSIHIRKKNRLFSCKFYGRFSEFIKQCWLKLESSVFLCNNAQILHEKKLKEISHCRTQMTKSIDEDIYSNISYIE